MSASLTSIMTSLAWTQNHSLVDAINEKYACDEPLQFDILVPKGGPGKQASGEIVLPRQLAINGCSVTVAGDADKLQRLCVDVVELDLTDNRLKNWAEVFALLHCMPKVNLLNLCNNPLMADSLEDISCPPFFPLLRKLILNNTLLTWEAVFKLIGLMPSLQELHLSLIELNELRPLVTDYRFPSIKELYINKTGIDNSENTLCILGMIFPYLENLVMLNNSVTSLADQPERIRESFPCLKSLNISETELRNWSNVEMLKFFPVLTSVRLQGIEFLQEIEEKLRRQLLIGYLPNVQRLNGSPVSETERDDAERSFIRHHMERQEKPQRVLYGGETDSTINNCYEDVNWVKSFGQQFVPCAEYYELEEIHGRLDPLVNIKFESTTLTTVMICFEGRSFLKTIDLSLTTKETRKILAREFGLRPTDVTLFHHDVAGCYGLDRMMYADRILRRYGIIEGSEIHVVPK